MELIHIFLFCLILFPLESQTQVCDANQKPSVKVCTDQDVTSQTGIIYIGAISAPDFERTSCECVITPYRQTCTLILQLLSSKSRNSIRFAINQIFIGRFYREGKTNITGATKISYSKLKNYESEGACLAVYSENREKFNLSCTKATKTTTTQTVTTSISKKSDTFSISSEIFNISSTRATRGAKHQKSTASVFRGSETFSTSSEIYNISSTKVTREAKHHDSTASVSRCSETTASTLEHVHTTVSSENDKPAAVILSVICVMLLVIIVCLLVYIRRLRYENQQPSNEHPYTQQVSEMEIRSEQVQVACSEATAAIASPNEYERLCT